MTPITDKPRRSLQMLLIAVALIAIACIYSSHANWYYIIGPLHNLDLGYPFADMQARLGIAEAINHGIDVNHEHNPFTPSGALNNKPLYTVTIMALLSLKTSDSLVLGILFSAIYCLWTFWLIRPTNWMETLISLAIFLSPPSLLLIERSNDDIIIFAFIMSVPLLLETGRVKGRVLGWLVISLLTPMKYYPAAVYALFLNRVRSLKEFFAYIAISVTFGLTLLWLIREEMKTLSERIPSPPSNCSFGKTLLFDTMGLESSSQLIAFAIGVLIIAGLGLYIILCPKIKQKVETHPREELYFLLGSSILTFCFLMNGNWDYRLGFLIPSLPLTFTFLRSSHSLPRNLSATYICGMLLTLWPEYLYFLGIIDPVEGQWVINLDNYQKIALIKHSASWVMIGSQILISCLILKPSILKLFTESCLLCKSKVKEN